MKVNILIFISLTVGTSLFGQKLVDVSEEYGIFGVEQDGYASGNSFVDFDQDGDDDITHGSFTGTEIIFFRNDGTEFTNLSLHDNAEEQRQINWVDFDNDKDLDLQITSSTKIRLFENIGDLNLIEITEQAGIETQPGDVDGVSYPSCWSDYDEDGLLDLLLTFRSFDTLKSIRLYKNNGDKTFSDVSNEVGIDDNLGTTPLAAGFMDLDNDNYEDIVIIQDYDAGHILLLNDQNGKFLNISDNTPIASGDLAQDGMTASFGDLNFDGLMDLYVTNTSKDAFFQNSGEGNLIENAAFYGLNTNSFTFGATFFDIDCDTDLDLYIADYGLLMNGETIESFFELDNDVLSFNSRILTAIIAGDFNDDGYPDLVGNKNMNTILYQNNNQKNNWLKINAFGTESNYFAVGTRLILEVEGKIIIRHIQCGQGFCSQQSYTQFFGLAENQVAEKLTIIWPNGLQEEFTNLDANTHYTFTEGEGYTVDFKYTGYTKISYCEETENPTVISAQGLNPPFRYTILNEQSDILLEGELMHQFEKDSTILESGFYTIKLTDQIGNEDSENFRITTEVFNSEAIISNIEFKGFTCDNSKGIWDLEIEVGPDFVDFNWSFPLLAEEDYFEDGVLYITNLQAHFNTYDLIINTGCSSQALSFDFNVNNTDPIGVEIEITDATSSTSSDGSITAIPTYGTPPYDYIWWDINGQPLTNQQTLENVLSGTYKLKIEDSLNCARELLIDLDFISSTTDEYPSDLIIYPNPANKELEFQFSGSSYLTDIRIYNPTGQMVKSVTKILQNNRIDISQIPIGLYIISYKIDGRPYTKKLIKH